MTTTGELYAIIEELELEDIGDAASYLGEEGAVGEESTSSERIASLLSCCDTLGLTSDESGSICHH